MVSRMKGYHSVSVDLESLPALVISTMVTLSVHTSFPTPLYLYMLARNEGNSRATCEDLVNLGWGPEEGEARAAVSRTISECPFCRTILGSSELERHLPSLRDTNEF